MTAAIDAGLDSLLAADGTTLAEQSRLAKGLHDKLVGGAEATKHGQAYLAGRVGSLAEVLGLASERCAPKGFEQMLLSDKFRPLLEWLVKKPLTNVELARAVGEKEETVCRKLRELRGVGATSLSKHGREVLNTILPAARAVLASPRDPDAFDMAELPGIAKALRPLPGEQAYAVVPRIKLPPVDARQARASAIAEAA